jgi:hypothetical protein
MKVIQIREDQFKDAFDATLAELERTSLREGCINVNLNSQVEVENFVHSLHRSFHYHVVNLQHKLEKI